MLFSKGVAKAKLSLAKGMMTKMASAKGLPWAKIPFALALSGRALITKGSRTSEARRSAEARRKREQRKARAASTTTELETS